MKSLLGLALLGGLLCGACLPGSGHAAEISFVGANEGIVTVVGELKRGDEARFAAIVGGLPARTVVMFGSPGGNLRAGIEIGKLIRMRGFLTGVPPGGLCVSACALAWLGGAERYGWPDSRIGFHAASRRDELGLSHETGIGNALVGAYLTNLGLTEQAVMYVTLAPPEEMLWLSPADAAEIGIAVDWMESAGAAAPVPLEVLAGAFMREHWRRVSGANDAYLAYAGRAYAPVVDYFGKTLRRDQVLKEQAGYVARWPDRHNVPTRETITCTPAEGHCVVEGTGTYEAVSAARNKRSSGSFTYRFLLAIPPDGEIQIMTESSEVTSREQRELMASQR